MWNTNQYNTRSHSGTMINYGTLQFQILIQHKLKIIAAYNIFNYGTITLSHISTIQVLAPLYIQMLVHYRFWHKNSNYCTIQNLVQLQTQTFAYLQILIIIQYKIWHNFEYTLSYYIYFSTMKYSSAALMFNIFTPENAPLKNLEDEYIFLEKWTIVSSTW
jgi:hypothetical protein